VQLYSRPKDPPPVIGAAITADTAEWMGAWADGLITVGATNAALRDNIEAFHRGGGMGKRLILQSAVGIGPADDAALHAAHARWRHAALDPQHLANLATPVEFDAATRGVRPEDLATSLRVSADLARHVAWLEDDIALGFTEIYLYPVTGNTREFIDSFGDTVLPRLRAGVNIAPAA
jgi:alkanesulfonate monooxygenase SsuD/methylene tetrahydromethanopterin reductase-like flavin-dependent oxidoreductase (luciferase family)